MKLTLQIFAAFIGVLLFFTIIAWFAQGSDFFLYRYFAPKYEQVRRETFEQTKSYRQGMSQQLQKMQFEYVQAKPENKAALASIILEQYADFDETALTADQVQFLDSLKADRLQPSN